MLEQLLRDLNSRKKAVREAAIREARALPPEQLLQLAEMEAKLFRRRAHIIFTVLPIMFIIGFIETLHDVLIKPHPDFSDWSLVFMQPFMIVSSLGWIASSATRSRWSLASVIAQADDPRFIGPALDFLAQTSDDNVKKSVRSALKNLLPQMRADQAEALTPEQRRALLIPLTLPYDDIELTLSVLKTLEQVGDEKAIPVVKKLTEEGAATCNMRSVKQAAMECLPSLKERAENAQQAQTLLRASDATVAVASDVLLRPAMANADDTPPEQLLRAAPTGNPMQ